MKNLLIYIYIYIYNICNYLIILSVDVIQSDAKVIRFLNFILILFQFILPKNFDSIENLYIKHNKSYI